MQSQLRLLLLKLVKFNGNISPLIKMGYQYTQVIDFFNILAEEGKLEKHENKLKITESGIQEINDLSKKLNRSNSGVWIEPAIESKIPQFDKNDIFLPDQNELSF